eukprot:5118940-Karenia_brevis.AAC.1
MENKRKQFLPTFQSLMLIGVPPDAAYHSSDCLELAPRDYHPCMRRMGHGRKVNHESIMDESRRAPGERYTPAECLEEASGHDFMESRKRVEDIYKWFSNVYSTHSRFDKKLFLLQLFFRKPYGRPVPEEEKQKQARESAKRRRLEIKVANEEERDRKKVKDYEANLAKI